MMTQKNFFEELKAAAEAMFPGAVVELTTAVKANETLTALRVLDGGSNIAPQFYLESFWDEYQKDEDMDRVTALFMKAVESGKQNIPEIDVSWFTDYAEAKDHLAVQVISRHGNEEFLSDKPHRELLDLAVFYRVIMQAGSDGLASVPVTYGLLEGWDITPEQLDADARANAEKTRPVEIRSIVAVLAEMMGISGEEFLEQFGEGSAPKMYVASTPDRVQGAAVLAYPKFFKQAAEATGYESFYILPSSIHEVLLVPREDGMDEETLHDMILEVNATQVAPKDRLSDSLYLYDGAEGHLILASQLKKAAV